MAERPLEVIRDKEKEDALSHVIKMRQRFNTNTETTGTAGEWVEPNQMRLLMISENEGTEIAEQLKKVNS